MDFEEIIKQYNKSLNQSPSNGGSDFLKNFKPLKAIIPLDYTSTKTLAESKLAQTWNNANNAKITLPEDSLLGGGLQGGSKDTKLDGFFKNTKLIGKIGDYANFGLDMIGGIAKPLDHVSNASNALKLGSKVAGMIPGPWGQGISVAANALATVDQLTGKKAKSQMTAGQTASGYDLAFNSNADTSYGGLFGNKSRRNTNRLTGIQDYNNSFKINASEESKKELLASSNSMQDIYAKNDIARKGGPNYMTLSASKGTKLNLSKIARQVAKKMDAKKSEENIKMNLIPSGALHARKHNLPEEIAEQVTHKGIPVVTFEDDGKIIQHAEVEREELTLYKELTMKLEDLLNQYKNADADADNEKNKILIKAGKLLTYEILENTQDNVNLINKIE